MTAHADCRQDIASCPDPLTCDAFDTIDAAREYAALEKAAQEADWAAEAAEYEEAVRDLAARTQEEDRRKLTSWVPVDLGGILDGTLDPPQPVYLSRTDGVSLLYAGRVNSFVGESEGGKTMLAYAACAQELDAGHGVVVVDFEGEAEDFVRWMVQLGVSKAAIRQHSRYIRPDDALNQAARLELRHACADVRPTLVVFDGVTEAMALHDLDDRVGTEVTRFMDLLPRVFARAGGSVILIDHTPHGGDRPTGSQMKRSAISGASYLFAKGNGTLVAGKHCKVTLKILKDRPGQVRRKAKGAKDPGTMHIVPAPDRGPNAVDIYVEAPSLGLTEAARPLLTMERVSQFLESQDGGWVSRTKVADSGGDKSENRDALDILVEDEYVEEKVVRGGERPQKDYRSVRPFRSEEWAKPDLPNGRDLTEYLRAYDESHPLR